MNILWQEYGNPLAEVAKGKLVSHRVVMEEYQIWCKSLLAAGVEWTDGSPVVPSAFELDRM